MSQNELSYLTALKATDNIEAPGVGTQTDSKMKRLLLFEAMAGEEKERKKNMLYNLTVELEIPEVKKRITLHAILDTGATTCVVDADSVPKEALEENSFHSIKNLFYKSNRSTLGGVMQK